MLNLRDISIRVLDGEHGRYSSSWGRETAPCDPYGRLYYVAGGNGVIEHHGEKFSLCEGGLYLIPPQTIAHYECSPFIDLYWIHFTALAFGVTDIFSLLEPSFEMSIEDLPYAQEVFDRLVTGWPSPDPGTKLEVDGIVRLLLGLFFRDKFDAGGGPRFEGLSRMRPVLDYIDMNLSNAVTLDEMAEVLHLHPHYFSNLFKDIMLVPPMTYMRRRRIENAQQLLLATKDSVKSIAWAVGYEDEFYFSRTFKKTVGVAPNDYRKYIREHSSI